MVNITLFEIHLDDASFEANAPFSGSEAEELSEEEAEEAVTGAIGSGDADGSGPPKVLPLVVGLVVLVGLAALVRKLRGGGDEEPPALSEDESAAPVDVETP